MKFILLQMFFVTILVKCALDVNAAPVNEGALTASYRLSPSDGQLLRLKLQNSSRLQRNFRYRKPDIFVPDDVELVTPVVSNTASLDTGATIFDVIFSIPIGILQAVNSMLKMIVGGKVNVYVG